MVGLLDVNVLVALSWPTHIHHEAAQAWFEKHRKAGWATCPATQAGLVRVLSNPAISPDALAPAEAFEHLRTLTQVPGHVFWADDRSLVGSRFVGVDRIVGYRQVTDAHLLGIALRHGGTLVSFDRGTRSIVPRGFGPEVVTLIFGLGPGP